MHENMVHREELHEQSVVIGEEAMMCRRLDGREKVKERRKA